MALDTSPENFIPPSAINGRQAGFARPGGGCSLSGDVKEEKFTGVVTGWETGLLDVADCPEFL